MHRHVFGVTLLLAFMVLVTAGPQAQAQKKKKADDDKPAKAAVDSDKLRGGEFLGTLKTTPGSDRTFVIETETPQLVPSGNGRNGGRGNNVMQQQNQLLQAQRAVATARTPQQRQQAMQRLQQAVLRQQQSMARSGGSGIPGYRVSMTKQQIEFQASEKVKVRTMLLPDQFDEKGNVKKYSKKELAELKGSDASLPGYNSGLDKLEPGQKVRVVLGPAPRSAAGADKDKEPDENPAAEKRSQVKMLVIVGESSSDTTAKGKGKAKNK
ncbi:MAG: hypothetical protein U0840_17060 [Gemmataceae bacterium]